MAKVIVADENEGRRSLLANTLERNGFDITRAATLRQAEGTALAIMPEVVLIDGEWKSGDAIDACQRLMSDPEFAFKCRVVILGRNVSQEYLMSAAQSGVSEVIRKPVDMNVLIQQLNKHTRKQAHNQRSKQLDKSTTSSVNGELPLTEEISKFTN